MHNDDNKPTRAIYAFVAFIIIILFLFFLQGCSSKQLSSDVPIPDSAPVVEGAFSTQATVLGVTTDVRFDLKAAVDASKGLPSEPAVRAAVANIEAALAKAEAAIASHPPEEVAALVADFHAAINQLKEVIKQRDAEIVGLKDADARFWNRVLIGLGIACTLGAVASGFFAGSIPIIGPMLGPRIAILLGITAATCYLLAYVAAWTRANPVKTGIIVVAIISVAGGLAWANHIGNRKSKIPDMLQK